MSKNIILLGTEKKSGKSLISTILCRYLKNNNLKVTPFKGISITDKIEILENKKIINKSQVIQAEASGSVIDTRINPVLIKLGENTIEKLFINGKSYCDFDINHFEELKSDINESLIKSFDSLSKDNDIVIVEGEGSCNNTVNKIGNIANFELASYINAKAILISNMENESGITSLYGTLSLLKDDELRRIKGIILNKFEGEEESLKKGIDLIEKKFKIPVLGVLPNLYFDIEKQKVILDRYYEDKKVILEVGIINLPNMWKKADFYPLENDKNIRLNYINNCDELEKIDFIIIPGTKKVFEDLKWLKNSGLYEKILQEKENSKLILGIGTGYDILGESIRDEYGIESEREVIEKGLGLLPIKTTYNLTKNMKVTKGEILKSKGLWKDISNSKIYGYETIYGEWELLGECKPFMVDLSNNIIGIMSNDENVIGTHLHGLFESNKLKHDFFNIIKKKFNVIIEDKLLEREYYLKYKREKYDLLVKQFKEHINMELLDQIIK